MPCLTRGEVTLEYETAGNPSHECVVLIAGHSDQLTGHLSPLAAPLAARGFFVVRFDNRDAGLSTRLTQFGDCQKRAVRVVLDGLWNKCLLGAPLRTSAALGVPWLLLHVLLGSNLSGGVSLVLRVLPLLWLALALGARAGPAALRRRLLVPAPDPAPSYSLAEWASDVVALLDHVGSASAHVVGASMGGFVAQELARVHPRRVRSLVLLCTSPGPGVGLHSPALGVQLWLQRCNARMIRAARAAAGPGVNLNAAMDAETDAAVVAAIWPHRLEVFRRTRTAAFLDEAAALEKMVANRHRAPDLSGASRQLLAAVCRPDNSAALRALALPRGALVVHGDADVIMPFENGRALLALIPGARILRLQGGGHDLPREWVPGVVEEMIALFEGRARPTEVVLTSTRLVAE